MSVEKKREILLIEDNPADIETMRRGIRRINGEIDLEVISEGVKAREFIDGASGSGSASNKDLIFLDLNLPGIDGRDLLNLLRANTDWDSVPVIVFTTSNNTEDITYAYQNGANAYLIKPGEMNEFLDIIKSVCHYWLQVIN
ncbi:MAG: response regulator [bacterium]